MLSIHLVLAAVLCFFAATIVCQPTNLVLTQPSQMPFPGWTVCPLRGSQQIAIGNCTYAFTSITITTEISQGCYTFNGDGSVLWFPPPPEINCEFVGVDGDFIQLGVTFFDPQNPDLPASNSPSGLAIQRLQTGEYAWFGFKYVTYAGSKGLVNAWDTINTMVETGVSGAAGMRVYFHSSWQWNYKF